MKSVKDILKETEYVMIFGARAAREHKHSNFGLNIENEIYKYGKQIMCYVVSSKENNPDSIGEIPVVEISEIIEQHKREGVIIISNALKKQDEIRNMLEIYGFQHILHGIRMYGELSRHEKEYYGQYGWNISMKHVPDVYEKKADMRNLAIYIVTSHNNTRQSVQRFDSKMLRYIQAGSALTDVDMCDIRDDTGDNISSKNHFYCELTAGYWIYKNDHVHRYVGLYHYSRVFNISDDEILELLNTGIDVILAEPVIYFASRGHYWCGDPLMEQVFLSKAPQYMDCFYNYIREGLLIPSNMVICSKKVFDDYYQWMMLLLETYEQELNARKIAMQPRHIGYIAEELTGIYFLHHSTDLKLFFVKQKNLY